VGNKDPREKVLSFMKKTIAFAVVFALWAFATVLSQPARALRPSNKKLPILAGAGANPQVVALLERSCHNCHSSNTEWPLYPGLSHDPVA
jgi:hypothetical protein